MLYRKIFTNKLLLKLIRYNSTNNVEKTALYDFHVKKNGKLVDFAGYLLPVQYTDLGIAASHIHTRKSSSLFDVSHMLQTYVRGKDAINCLESICTADIKNLNDNTGTLTVFTNESGGILDDLIVSKISDNELYIVSNAAMKNQDMQIMENAIKKYKSDKKDVAVEFLNPESQSLLALQGPKSMSVLQQYVKVNLGQLYFMHTIRTDIGDIKNCRITRCGYTGEDGFEISVESRNAIELAELFLNHENNEIVKLAGLGARDSLRLEAGLCLYGSDIDTKTTPIEANLSWLVAKRRRNETNFPGALKINDQLKNGVDKRRIGIRMISGAPARHDVEIYNEHKNEKIGQITSGCPSPSLSGNVAMGYVKESYKKLGTKVHLKIRDKMYEAQVSKMPFLPSKYYTIPK